MGFSGGIDSLVGRVDCADGIVLDFSGEIDFLLIVADGSIGLTLILGFSGGVDFLKEARDRSPGSIIDLVNLDFLVVPGPLSDLVDFKEADDFPDFLDFGRLTPVATEDVD